MTVSKVLREQAGIQYQGVQDKSEADPRDSLIDSVIVGNFKRGRTDKPFKVTTANIRSILGYDPENPDYVAVEDALSGGAPYVWVQRFQYDPVCVYFSYAEMMAKLDKTLQLSQEAMDRQKAGESIFDLMKEDTYDDAYYVLPDLSKEPVMEILNNIQSVQIYGKYVKVVNTLTPTPVDASFRYSQYTYQSLNTVLDFTENYKRLTALAEKSTAAAIEDYLYIRDLYEGYSSLQGQFKELIDEVMALHKVSFPNIEFAYMTVETACQSYTIDDQLNGVAVPILEMYADIDISFKNLGAYTSPNTTYSLRFLQKFCIGNPNKTINVSQYCRFNEKWQFIKASDVDTMVPSNLVTLAATGYKSVTAIAQTEFHKISLVAP